MAKKESARKQATDQILQDATSLSRGQESHIILALQLLHLQSKYVRILVDAGLTQHPADLADEFIWAVCYKLLNVL